MLDAPTKPSNLNALSKKAFSKSKQEHLYFNMKINQTLNVSEWKISPKIYPVIASPTPFSLDFVITCSLGALQILILLDGTPFIFF